MARIAGVNLPLNKRSEIGLTYIYGIGRSTRTALEGMSGSAPDPYSRPDRDEVGEAAAGAIPTSFKSCSRSSARSRRCR